jgi:hypothetical protein
VSSRPIDDDEPRPGPEVSIMTFSVSENALDLLLDQIS